MKNPTSKKNYRTFAASVAMAVSLNAAIPAHASNTATWTPVVTDTLVKMDIKSLDRELNKQFAGSSLAGEQAEIDAQISQQAITVKGIREAIDRGNDEESKRVLKLREINERAGLIAKLEKRTDLRIEKAKSDISAYSKIWKKINRSNGARSSDEKAFIVEQNEALSRIESIEASITSTPLQPDYGDSKYNHEYALISYDMARLQKSIDRHSANSERLAATKPLTKSEYVTQRLVSAQSELSLAQEEKKLTGLMARMLSLDATAMEEDSQPGSLEYADKGLSSGHANNVVELFIK